MFAKISKAILVACIAAGAVTAQASMIGDEVTLEGCFPTFADCGVIGSVVVTADDSDGVAWGASITNVQGDAVLFSVSAGYGTGVEANAIRITGMDWVNGPAGKIENFTLSTDITGLQVSIIEGGHGLIINVGGADGLGGTATIALEHTPVPLPAAAWLFAAAFAFLGIRRNLWGKD